MLYVFTTCALNFVPCAKLLAESVKRHLPQARFVITLTDDTPDGFRLEDEGFDEALYLEDFADDLGNPRGWAFSHTIMELATALKPFVAAKLMEREDCDAVMFFDADCVLYDRLEQMCAAVQTHSLVLTPHASLLHENADWIFFERNPLKVGTFNLGYFGLQNNETGRAIASWWRFRLRDHCLIDPEQGLFTDQKWIDLLPSYTDDIKVLREPVYNVARWNTFQRTITKEGERYFVDGEPLQFIHFSGFYKVGPYVRGLYDRSSEPYVKNIEVLQALSLWYSSELDRVRTQGIYGAPWPLGYYGNGEEIPEADRRRYRASQELQNRFPDPFSTSSLNSYWLYCRRQERMEAEKTFAKLPGLAEMVPSSVRSHNAILRRHNETLNTQLVETTTALRRAQELSRLFDTLATEVKTHVSKLALITPSGAMADKFADFLGEDGFDRDWYLETNPDVGEARMEPLTHFLQFGLKEERAPSPIVTADGLVFRYLRHLMYRALESDFGGHADAPESKVSSPSDRGATTDPSPIC